MSPRFVSGVVLDGSTFRRVFESTCLRLRTRLLFDERLLPDKEISEAAGVLEMMSQTPEQLMLYNAWLKLQRDEAARILQARQEGLQEGEARGLQIGRITVLQELLGLRPFNADEFSGYDAAQLNSLAEQLQQQLRDRSS